MSATHTPPSRLPDKASDSGIGKSGSQSSPSVPNTAISSPKGSRLAKPADPDFEPAVLTRRGIILGRGRLPVLKPWFHFGTPPPPSERVCDFYGSLPGLAATTVWLEGQDAFVEVVLQEYRSMHTLGENEAEFAAYAIKDLLKREPRHAELSDTERIWRCERKIEFSSKPEDFWLEPPVLHPALKTYHFSLRPDCSYWVSLQAFNPEYRTLVKSFVSVRQNRILCPYLTIEFKKNEKTVSQATVQVAASAAIALYNRYRLKLQRLEATGSVWTDEHRSHLRHYGLVLAGRGYQFWCMEANLDLHDGSWRGCCMFKLLQSECESRANVRHFIDWINEIHHWGLTAHALSCEDDIKHSIQKAGGGARTSLG
ncbi:hypothetical protein GTA08_BOTSDO12646 [Botryosphaeria dothidea]|uniref:DUF7924 domain-containing protein n=1 Tax=Botryosphaeria dothidea TaxID=55169 RepID=A0A8H4J1Z0_9PEZI|nr:hypothetical protein GTA08_BOTSDO14016 [Botryosphaeria dothidea]KAF4311903.1 hypothetical protein GTA08_BOTSDO12646 [Botryosphaeria dothidea]